MVIMTMMAINDDYGHHNYHNYHDHHHDDDYKRNNNDDDDDDADNGEDKKEVEEVCLFVCWLLIVPATCECVSGTDLLRQFYVLPH